MFLPKHGCLAGFEQHVFTKCNMFTPVFAWCGQPNGARLPNKNGCAVVPMRLLPGLQIGLRLNLLLEFVVEVVKKVVAGEPLYLVDRVDILVFFAVSGRVAAHKSNALGVFSQPEHHLEKGLGNGYAVGPYGFVAGVEK